MKIFENVFENMRYGVPKQKMHALMRVFFEINNCQFFLGLESQNLIDLALFFSTQMLSKLI